MPRRSQSSHRGGHALQRAVVGIFVIAPVIASALAAVKRADLPVWLIATIVGSVAVVFFIAAFLLGVWIAATIYDKAGRGPTNPKRPKGKG